MEHIDGITLQKAARRVWAVGESVPMEVALRAIADAARGLHYAHTLRDDDGVDISLVHRDISPDNLMLTRDGVTKVLDFGVAKTHDGDPMTTDGELKGKIPFMSPEQIAGLPLDGRSDLWSLGVTLYWLLTGARPFHAPNDLAVLHKIVNAAPASPRTLNPLIPVPLENLVLDLLAKDREQRIGTGSELSQRLLALLGPAAAGPESAEFAARALALPDAPGNSYRTETLAASRPHTAWLKATLEEFVDDAGRATAATPTNDAATTTTPEPSTEPVGPVATSTTTARRASVAIGVAIGAAVSLGALALAVFPRAPVPATVATDAGTTLPEAAPTTTPTTTAPTTTAPTTTAPTTTAPTATAMTATAMTTTAMTTTAPTATAPTTNAPTTNAPTTTAPTATAPTTNAPTTNAPTATAPTTTAPTTNAPTTTAPTVAPVRPHTSVLTKAPAHVRWETEKGVRLGVGSTSLALAPGTTRVIARDTHTGGRILVDVQPGGTVDWDALPRGRLDVRVDPWAEVVLGDEKLGTTPITPLAVVAGTYVVVLVYEGQRVEKTVDVVAGRDTRLTHRF
jgi:serine/threonine-protein kinase